MTSQCQCDIACTLKDTLNDGKTRTIGGLIEKKGYDAVYLGVVESEKTGRTTKKGVFAGGDIVTGAATVILAAGAGRAAGMAIDKYLKDDEWWDPNAPKPEAAPAAK